MWKRSIVFEARNSGENKDSDLGSSRVLWDARVCHRTGGRFAGRIEKPEEKLSS